MRRKYLFFFPVAVLLATSVVACSRSLPYRASAASQQAIAAITAAPATVAPPRFAVTIPAGKLPRKVSGRLMVILTPGGIGLERDLRDRLGDVEASRGGAAFGMDATGGVKGSTILLNSGHGSVAMFPAQVATEIPAGTYRAQAVYAWNPDLRSADAPGNLYSTVQQVTLPTPKGKPIPITLSEQEDAEKTPEEDDTLKFIKLRSPLLSQFYKRPIYLRAGIILPPEWKDDPTKRFPLCVRIGGFHTRYTAAVRTRPHAGIVQIMLDGDGPFGDAYQVNSAVSGPYGDAVTQELIPEIEKRYRCGGKASARFTTGGSTGGWVSLALQVFYPDTFGGCWSGYPDPLDFHAYQTVNLYDDTNAYTAPDGIDRVSMRDRITGATHFTIREECALENVNGFGGSYVTSGGQWGVWNAVFGRKGKNGRAVPLWDPHTGQINHAEAEYAASHYDLRRYCAERWKTLGPKLTDKIHLWVGEHDEYFLNDGVHRFDDFLKTATPSANARIEYDPLAGHGWEPRSSAMILDEMIAASDAAEGK